MNPTLTRPSSAAMPLGLVVVALIALSVRALPLALWPWSQPLEVHHPDEHLLPFEALAQWEGVTPREIGWPAATTRLALSALYAGDLISGSYRELVDAGSAPDAMARVVLWSARRIDDPDRLFLIGRMLSVAVGLGVVLVVHWAAGRWLGRDGAWIAALVVAISPLATAYSQLVLADMTGALFAALAVGLFARPLSTIRTAAVVGLLIGLSIASKYHFALWLLPGLIWVGCSPKVARLRAGAALLGSAAAAFLLLVPWPWLNPVLFLKEFVGVVGEKVLPSDDGFWPLGPLVNLRTGLHGLGWLTSCGVALAVILPSRLRERRWLPLSAGLVAGLLLIMVVRIMHARYSLLLLPVVPLVCAEAYLHLIKSRRRNVRRAGRTLLIVLTLLTCVQLVARQVDLGDEPPALQAAGWLKANAMPGQSIAVHSVFPHHLPRTGEQLEHLVAERQGEDAYLRKMASNGYRLATTSQPFHAAVLCDERYAAHWYLRESSIRRPGQGFEITLYDAAPRFHSLPEPEARRLFLEGLAEPASGFDYFLTERAFDELSAPLEIFSGAVGRPLLLYARSTSRPAQDLSP